MPEKTKIIIRNDVKKRKDPDRQPLNFAIDQENMDDFDVLWANEKRRRGGILKKEDFKEEVFNKGLQQFYNE